MAPDPSAPPPGNSPAAAAAAGLALQKGTAEHTAGDLHGLGDLNDADIVCLHLIFSVSMSYFEMAQPHFCLSAP